MFYLFVLKSLLVLFYYTNLVATILHFKLQVIHLCDHVTWYPAGSLTGWRTTVY